jgi:hypothetical protein
MLGYTDVQQQRKVVTRHVRMISQVPRVSGDDVHPWVSVPFITVMKRNSL